MPIKNYQIISFRLLDPFLTPKFEPVHCIQRDVQKKNHWFKDRNKQNKYISVTIAIIINDKLIMSKFIPPVLP